MTMTLAVRESAPVEQAAIGADGAPGCLGELDPADRRREQVRTLTAPRRNYSIAARVLFRSLTLVYGRRRRLATFRVLELIARVPYQAWEQAGYAAITHHCARVGFSRRVFDRSANAAPSRTTSSGTS